MIDVIMHMEKKLSREQFHDDAANRPNIAFLVPLTTFQQNLRTAILTGVYCRTMRFVSVCCPSEIYQFYVIAGWNRVLLVCAVFLDYHICRAKENVLRF